MAYTVSYNPTLRQVKGVELTWAETDNNWNDLNAELSNIALELTSASTVVAGLDTRVGVLETNQVNIPDGTINNQQLIWSAGTNSWQAQSVNTQLPTGTANNQQLIWNTATSGWEAQSVNTQLPTGTANTDVLLWNTATSGWESSDTIDLGTF